EFNDTATVTITVAPVIVDGNGVVQVGGTTSGDNILVQSGSIRYNNTTYPLSGSKVVVHGHGGNDTISVTSANIAVEFYGDDGDDYLSGGSLNDILDGGAGTDRLLGNAGEDRLYGGGGSDNISGGVGNDYLSGDGYLDALHVEQQAADAGRDTLSGDAGDDTIHGGAGMDSLLGGIGNDYLSGGEDGDALDGGDDHDILLGGEGGDKLYGRAGNDVLIGGAGLDTLLGYTGSDLIYGGDVIDTLTETTLRAIALQWITPATQASAANQLASYRQDDLVSDSLNGEADDDWYLIFAKDLVTATERFPGNRKTQL
ncbi:MAG TPA: calcium-binding protein, partial [Pirellulaceae bacterium]|nr:calcium-binding protein [Pirellulaceae bacterium]